MLLGVQTLSRNSYLASSRNQMMMSRSFERFWSRREGGEERALLGSLVELRIS
jgi:hypothetical protein